MSRRLVSKEVVLKLDTALNNTRKHASQDLLGLSEELRDNAAQELACAQQLLSLQATAAKEVDKNLEPMLQQIKEGIQLADRFPHLEVS